MDALMEVFGLYLGYFAKFLGYVKVLPTFLYYVKYLWGLLIRVFKRKEEFLIDYESVRIRTLVTANPKRVSDWSKRSMKNLIEEGIPRTGSLVLFSPVKENLPFFFVAENHMDIVEMQDQDYSFLVIFLETNECLIYPMNGDTWIPIHLRDLFAIKNMVMFLYGFREIRDLLVTQNWSIPRNFLDLRRRLIQFNGNNSSFRSVDPIYMAYYSLATSFGGYEVPKGMVDSDWDPKKLNFEQVRYLTMKAYAAYLLAGELGLRKKSYLIDLLSDEQKLRLPDSEALDMLGEDGQII